MLLEEDIKLINNIIETATMDGGDAGGAYHQAEEEVYDAIYEYLKFYNVIEDWKIIKKETGWGAYEIVKA